MKFNVGDIVYRNCDKRVDGSQQPYCVTYSEMSFIQNDVARDDSSVSDDETTNITVRTNVEHYRLLYDTRLYTADDLENADITNNDLQQMVCALFLRAAELGRFHGDDSPFDLSIDARIPRGSGTFLLGCKAAFDAYSGNSSSCVSDNLITSTVTAATQFHTKKKFSVLTLPKPV